NERPFGPQIPQRQQQFKRQPRHERHVRRPTGGCQIPLTRGSNLHTLAAQASMRTRQFGSTDASGRCCAFLLLGCFVLATTGVWAIAATEEAPTTNAPAANTNSLEVLRSYLQLQEQLHGVQLMIEESRKQAEAAAGLNAQAVANRLQVLEQSLAVERA